MSLTLVDSLDALLVFGNTTEFVWAADWLSRHLSFDLDVRVNVFEVTIRGLGGLLSAHALLTRSAALGAPLHAAYAGGLLAAALDLGRRLMPAFATPTGLPAAWVNLRSGVIPGDTRDTCTAGAGTLLLEFAALSAFSGDPTYEAAAARALRALHARRSGRDLPGSTLNVDTGVRDG